MKLGVEVGLGPDHIVLDGDPAGTAVAKRLDDSRCHLIWG